MTAAKPARRRLHLHRALRAALCRVGEACLAHVQGASDPESRFDGEPSGRDRTAASMRSSTTRSSRMSGPSAPLSSACSASSSATSISRSSTHPSSRAGPASMPPSSSTASRCRAFILAQPITSLTHARSFFITSTLGEVNIGAGVSTICERLPDALTSACDAHSRCAVVGLAEDPQALADKDPALYAEIARTYPHVLSPV